MPPMSSPFWTAWVRGVGVGEGSGVGVVAGEGSAVLVWVGRTSGVSAPLRVVIIFVGVTGRPGWAEQAEASHPIASKEMIMGRFGNIRLIIPFFNFANYGPPALGLVAGAWLC